MHHSKVCTYNNIGINHGHKEIQKGNEEIVE